ncbi:hypothetical protein Hanom_Chr11g00967591 [Helianthus anomalus]
MPLSWEELDQRLANCEILRPIIDEINLNMPPYSPIPINPEPMNLKPIMPQEQLPNPAEEWWTNDWAYQNLMNNLFLFTQTINLHHQHTPNESRECDRTSPLGL